MLSLRNRDLFFIAIFAYISYLFLGGLRDGIGNDWEAYELYFTSIRDGKSIVALFEPIFFLFAFISSRISGFGFFIFLNCLIYLLAVWMICKSNLERLVFLFFLSTTYFWGDLGTLRQTLMLSCFYLLIELRVYPLFRIALPLIHFSGVFLIYPALLDIFSPFKRLVLFMVLSLGLVVLLYSGHGINTGFIELDSKLETLSSIKDASSSPSLYRNILVSAFVLLIARLLRIDNPLHVAVIASILWFQLLLSGYDTVVSTRVGSLSRLSETYILTQVLITFHRKGLSYLFIGVILSISLFRLYYSFSYEPELYIPYKNIISNSFSVIQ